MTAGPYPSTWLRGRGWATTVIRLFEAYPVATVFGVGLALRLFAVASLGDVVYDQGGDSVRYLSIARDILEGRPYGITAGDLTRVPPLPVLSRRAPVDLRDWLKSVALTQAVIGAATAVVLMWTARDVSGDRWSWFVGLLWATYPPAILNTVVVFPQTLQVFWLVTAFWLVVLGTVRRSFVLCAAAGVCWSASCLTRSGNLLFLPIFALAPLLFSWLRTGSSRHWAAAAAAVIFAAGAVSAGWWTARDFHEDVSARSSDFERA